MKPKMQSAITSITLTEATFHGETVSPTFVNFFYGKNGAGKSTIARSIKGNAGVVWSDGRAATDYDVLVYDTDFIEANLRSYDNLAGVFTVNEVNITIQQQVDALNDQRKQMLEQHKAKRDALAQKTTEKDTALTTFQDACWRKTAEQRSVFDTPITGKKKSNLFAQEILTVTPVEHDYEELKKLCETVYSGDAQVFQELAKAGPVTYAAHPGFELMGKQISSRSDTDFARFIRALNATDWVRDGYAHYHGKSDGACPYCHQPLP